MPFPIQQDTLSFENAPALLAGVEADANAGGGTLVEATPPHTWIGSLVQSNALESGEAVGLAFQLADDVLDEDGFVRFLGVEGTKQKASTLVEEALEHSRALPHPKRLEALAMYTVEREH